MKPCVEEFAQGHCTSLLHAFGDFVTDQRAGAGACHRARRAAGGEGRTDDAAHHCTSCGTDLTFGRIGRAGAKRQAECCDGKARR